MHVGRAKLPTGETGRESEGNEGRAILPGAEYEVKKSGMGSRTDDGRRGKFMSIP
jgi:hypothetical protein